ncbi:ABC transporter ATP-binding protein [Ruminococcus sp.]|uniref:ABC transporter ATP-binding protein n=1 Tax=Ruminococcus sp. TaxID=41978 RepID=UPI001B06A1E5|nr:ABC transporter ATP-binding protein [Ruminococcus sp.]MBO5557636.1 ABC transporter ATP-binding protein [Ruminococcus sp.]
MKKAILSAKGLCRSFAHNGGQIHILTGMDVDIYEKDFTVIMGASGSGKSTTLYALSGMDRATGGQVIYGGEDIVRMSEKKLCALRHSDFGFIFQQMHLVSNLTMFENITVPGYLSKTRSAAEIDKRALELMDKMGISHLKTHLPSQCSGGEQQRCAIARAVIHAPVLLFADEPTGALNKKNTTEVLNLLTDLNRAGQSILMVTHDARAACRASRLLYIEDGRVIGDLELTPYEKQEEHSREQQINAWLASMEW